MEIYLDNAATTPMDLEVIESMTNSMTSFYGNPSSLHRKGLESEKLIKKAKKAIMEQIGAKSGELWFTSGGTEANNLAIKGVIRQADRDGLIVSSVEHPSVLTTAQVLENLGHQVSYIRVDEAGDLSMDDLMASINDKTKLVSIMLINNENGVINNIMGITQSIKERYPQVLVHTDAVQGFGKVSIDVEKLGVDMMTISAHKIHGPKGVGALYVKKGVSFQPLFHGGMQQKGLRPGTENLHGIIGFAKAAELLSKGKIEHIEALHDRFKKNIDAMIEEVNWNTVSENASPYVINVAFIDAKAEVLLHTLESKGVYVSSGSACHSSKDTNSHVLKAMGLSNNVMDSSIRVSFSRMTTIEEIDQACEKIKESVAFIRKMVRR